MRDPFPVRKRVLLGYRGQTSEFWKNSEIYATCVGWRFGNLKKGLICFMIESVTHERSEETIESKTLRFRSLSPAERMDMLCAFTELLRATNPEILEQRDAQPIEGRVRVLATP
jgi:hypothetical protein